VAKPHLFLALQEQSGTAQGSRRRNREERASLSIVSTRPSGLCAVVETAAPENIWKEKKTGGESQEQEHEKEEHGDSEVG